MYLAMISSAVCAEAGMATSASPAMINRTLRMICSLILSLRVWPHLCHGKFRVLPHRRRTKTQNDMVSRHAGFDELIGNPAFRAIALNPNLAIDDIDMHQTSMNAAIILKISSRAGITEHWLLFTDCSSI
jgi:hypothetical protein